VVPLSAPVSMLQLNAPVTVLDIRPRFGNSTGYSLGPSLGQRVWAESWPKGRGPGFGNSTGYSFVGYQGSGRALAEQVCNFSRAQFRVPGFIRVVTTRARVGNSTGCNSGYQGSGRFLAEQVCNSSRAQFRVPGCVRVVATRAWIGNSTGHRVQVGPRLRRRCRPHHTSHLFFALVIIV